MLHVMYYNYNESGLLRATACVFLTVVVLIIPLIFGHEELLCSDSNIIDALETPTGYCQTQGCWPYSLDRNYVCIAKLQT